MEHLPAALAGRRFHGAAGADRAPVDGGKIHVHPEALEQVGGDVALRLGDRLVLGHQTCDRLARIAALLQQFLGAIEIARALEDLAAFLGVERRARGEEARQRFPETVVVADDGAHVVFLAHRHQNRAPRPHVVERRVEVVHAEAADIAERIGDIDRDIAVLAQQRNQVGNRILPPVDLAVLQRGGGGRGVRHHNPFDALGQHSLAAREPRAGLRARRIVGKFFERGPGARNPFVLHEAHGAAADIFGNLLERVGLGDALGHDEGDLCADLAERQQHLREWFLEHPLHVAVVDSREILLDGPNQEAHLVARAPAFEARHHVPCQHRFAVVKFQSWPQAERPGQPVGRDLFGFHHLALRLELFVHPIKRVPDHGGGIAHHVLRAPDRVEIGEIGLRHETKRARGSALRERRGG